LTILLLKVSISPEFNPIEELFRKIKNLLRNKDEHSNLENDIKYTFYKKVLSKKMILNHFLIIVIEKLKNMKIWNRYTIYFNQNALKINIYV
jgi:hypothetical protein